MSAHASTAGHPAPTITARAATVLRGDAGYQAFMIMRLAFVVAPIAFGVDKFFNVLVDWTQYLAPWINDIIPGNAHDAMHIVGVIEIAAGVLVAVKPRFGAPVVVAWLAGIIVSLLTYSGYYDVALRDFGLLLGALSLTRLASFYDSRGRAH